MNIQTSGNYLNKKIVRSVLCLVLTVSCASMAADNGKSPQGDNWESIAKLPDWGGLWELSFSPSALRRNSEPPELTPVYQAKLDAYNKARAEGHEQDTPAANCVPNGMPVIMTQPYPIEFLFTPGKVTILIEAYNQFRQVFTDGRGHPDDLAPTFNGHAIGHWEGDTLVVDTVGFVTDTSLGLSWGMRHSDKLHIIERIHTTAPDTMEITTTVIDPEALVKPWTTTKTYGRHRDWDLAEYICQQNNRNSVDENGRAAIDLEHE